MSSEEKSLLQRIADSLKNADAFIEKHGADARATDGAILMAISALRDCQYTLASMIDNQRDVLSYRDYWTEIDSVVSELRDALKEDRNLEIHDWLHERIDSHQFVIYTYKAEQVMHHTENEDAYIEELGNVEADSWSSLVSMFAYMAMMRDVQDHSEFPSSYEDVAEDEEEERE